MQLTVKLALLAVGLSAAGCSYSYRNPSEQLGPGEVGGRTTADTVAIDGVSVSVKGASTDPAGALALDAVSRASGRFTMLPLPAGTHRLTFRKGKERALQRDVEIGYGPDGQLQGLWLGDVDVPLTAGLVGTVVPPDRANDSIVDGLVFDETTGGLTPLEGDHFSLEGITVGLHRLSLVGTDQKGRRGVAGPFEVTIVPGDAGTIKSVGIIALHATSPGTSPGTSGTVKLRLLIAGQAPGLDLTKVKLTGLPDGVNVGTSSSGLIQVADLPEGYFTVGLELPPGAPANLSPPPHVSFVAVGGTTVDLGSLYAVTSQASSQAWLSCRTDADCAPSGSCSSGLCVGWTPPDVAPANVPYCEPASLGCVAGKRYSSSGGSGDGTSTCVAWAAGTAAVACGSSCTPDGLHVISSAPDKGGCSATPLAFWSWTSGPKSAAAAAVYGTKGLANATNIPGPRESASTWTDPAGILWLFGGAGYDSAANFGQLSDLWRYDGSAWTWVAGSNLRDASGSFGILGQADPSSNPGGRNAASSWVDAAGHLWLFGGDGFDSYGLRGDLCDLWRFDGTAWAWMGNGTENTRNGTYGARGVADPSNQPGSRYAAATAVDSHGTVWLFGGWGEGFTSKGDLNDLWRFDGSQWTWMGGGDQAGNWAVYGALGVADPVNGPGGLEYANLWSDSQDRLWLFGGYGPDSIDTGGDYNTIWRFDGTSWTWMAGSDRTDAAGVYGTLGAADPANTPGARNAAAGWIDAADNLWIFGGYVNKTNGIPNDLWKFDGTAWTWVSGSNLENQSGVYGTLGVPDPANTPGGRYDSAFWIDASGHLWLFGGYGHDAAGTLDNLNDLWRY
jgi:N-acetylneuraminic acid mutarotase